MAEENQTRAVARFRLEKRDDNGNIVEILEAGEDLPFIRRTLADGTIEELPLDLWPSRMQAQS